ncbi:MAG: ATP-binding protein [Nitrospirota bacterium]
MASERREASPSPQQGPRVQRPYGWLQGLIIVMTLVALSIGAVALYYVERRLVATTGENLSLAAAEVADKLDRLLVERHGDVLMMARAFGRHRDGDYLTAYLSWMRTAYPVYLWMGVTDPAGRIVAATDPATVGQDQSRSPWFLAARAGGKVHVGDVEPYEAAGGVESVAFTAPIVGPRGEFLGTVTTRVGVPALEAVVTGTIRAFQARESFPVTLEYQFLTWKGDAFVDSDIAHKGNVNLKKMGLPSALLSESGVPGYTEEEHLRRHVQVVTGYAMTRGYGPFQGLKWTVLVRMDRLDILTPIYEVLWKLALAGAVVWLPMFGLLLWSTGRVRREWAQARQESGRARAAEANLREQNERFELVTQATHDWIWDWNVATNEVWWNDSLEVLFGYQSREIRPSLEFWYEGVHPGEREKVLAGRLAALQAGERFWVGEYRFRRADGTYAEVIDRAHALYDGRGRPVRMIGSVRDITERKQAEKRQVAQLAVNQVLVESATLADAAPRLLQAVCDTTGWELGAVWRVDRIAGVLRCETIWHVPAVSVEEFVTLSRSRTFTPGVGLPGRVWESGQPAWIPDVVKDPNFPRAPVAAKVGLHAAFGFPVLLGREVLGILEFFSHEIRQPDQDLLGMMADIGVKLGQFIERRQLEEQLRQSQKMEAIGRLAGGIAHDFNNLLTVIIGHSQLLSEQMRDQGGLRDQVEEIKRAGERAGALTKQLLAFSRSQMLTPQVVDLNETVAAMGGMLRRLLGEDITLVSRPDPALRRIKADPTQLEQVVLNLAVNARDAMPRGGRLTVETANVELREPYVHEHVIVPAGSYAVLAVQDTGGGMDRQTRARIFEPFFTTKEKGQGTGLGLATVYGIVKQSGGYILVDSEPGQGATFRVYFPPSAEKAKADQPPRPPSEVPGGSETVLLVEDEDSIRTMLSGVLRSYGYQVLESRSGEEALRIAGAHQGPIQILLTDVIMPGMNGREVAERLVLLRRGMKVLYMSGHTTDVIVQRGVLQADTAFLAKPFTPAALARKLREVLDAP